MIEFASPWPAESAAVRVRQNGITRHGVDADGRLEFGSDTQRATDYGFAGGLVDSSVGLTPAARNLLGCMLIATALSGAPIGVASGSANSFGLTSPQATNLDAIVAPRTKALVIAELDRLEGGGSDIHQAFVDARAMANAMPLTVPMPQIWTDSASEIVFEWTAGSSHAVMSFEGDEHFAYAMLVGELFAPGEEAGAVTDGFPADLASYLDAARGLS